MRFIKIVENKFVFSIVLIMDKIKILIISLAGIGDTLMATSLIHELKQIYPKSEIDCLVMWEGSRDILKNNLYINRIYQFNMLNKGFFKTINFCRRLKRRKYDISINTFPQGKIHYAVIAGLINAKIRIGHKYKKRFFNFPPRFFFNKIIRSNPEIHCVENNLNLLSLLKKKKKLQKHNYEIYFSDNEAGKVNQFLKINNLNGKMLIGFHIGSGSLKNLALRRWPLENYIQLIKKLIDFNRDIAILLFGGKDEEKANEYIASLNPERILNIKTNSIKESAAIIKECSIFISVDTSLMHLASAVNVKNQLIIETPTFSKIVYPYQGNFTILKNPRITKKKSEYYKYDGSPIKMNSEKIKWMMHGVSVESVYDCIKLLLEDKPSSDNAQFSN